MDKNYGWLKKQKNMSLFNLFNKPEKTTQTPTYKVGQEWHYHTCPGEEESTVKITKIEYYTAVGCIIHIAILNVNIQNPQHPNGLKEILHIPIAEAALRKSTTQLKDDRCELPDYEFGFVHWKNLYDEEKAGYFDTSVDEIVNYLESGSFEKK
ncbi:hypothetical protein CDW55_05550 [Chryseobacterium sp. VAUSW3]|nr:hypothetical protein CDW55_05550 [Chryseobacterium sp. VAUSW3]